jgi:hypothetical protein
MLYAEDGLFFEWGIDDDIVWILDKRDGRSALIYMEVILKFLETAIGSCENVNIICRSFIGRWNVVMRNKGKRGYEIRSLGDAKTYQDARSTLLRLFGAGTKVHIQKQCEDAFNSIPGQNTSPLEYQPLSNGWEREVFA